MCKQAPHKNPIRADHSAYLPQCKWDGSRLYLCYDLKAAGARRREIIGDRTRTSIGKDARNSRDVARQQFPAQRVVSR
jgi:hypothetical protein